MSENEITPADENLVKEFQAELGLESEELDGEPDVSTDETPIGSSIPVVMKKGDEHVVIGQAFVTVVKTHHVITAVLDQNGGAEIGELLTSKIIGGLSIGGILDRHTLDRLN